MTYAFSPPRLSFLFNQAILIDVARCWSEALQAGRAVQPSLYRILHPHNIQILTPVLDSLLRFYERALGRSLTVGTASHITRDELQLVGIVDGSLDRRVHMICADEAATGLDSAISSTRIMMALAAQD